MDTTAESGAPPCTHHPETGAVWHCPSCETALCGDCVRVYAGRDTRLAACKRCGGLCDPLLDRAPEPEGLRAGAIEDEESLRRRQIQDQHAPLGVLTGAGLLLLMILGARGIEGLGLWLAALAMAAASMIAGFWVAGRVTDADFEPLGPTLLKLGAAGAALHAARLGSWAILAPEMPSGYGAVGMAEAIGLLGPVSISFVLAPMGVLIAAVMGLFRLDLFDRIVTVVALFLADAFTLFFLVDLGLFG